MMKGFILFHILIFNCLSLFAQTVASFDGIKAEALNSNRTTYYAIDSYWQEVEYKGKMPYNHGNPNSYENFFKKHGNTIFADYAMIDANCPVKGSRYFQHAHFYRTRHKYF